MNFDQAASAHISWKEKLLQFLADPDGSLSVSDVGVDDQCELGQWIYGEGTRFSAYPQYQALRRNHASFHEAVAEVIRGAQLGLSVRAETALGKDSPFHRASAAVVSAILDLKRTAASAGLPPATSAQTTSTAATAKAARKAEFVDWDPSYSVGVAELDEHHRYFLSLFNVLQYTVHSGRQTLPVQMVLEELSDYAKNHFEIEEGLMEKAGYPALLEHRKLHQFFLARTSEFPQILRVASPDEALLALESLRTWLITHILEVDRKYSDHLHASGVH